MVVWSKVHSNVTVAVIKRSNEQHVLSVHKGKKPFQCDICDCTLSSHDFETFQPKLVNVLLLYLLNI